MIQYTKQQFNDIQTVVNDNWLNIIRSILMTRVSKISNNEIIIQLFLNLEDRSNLHPLIIEVITSLAIKPLEEQFASNNVGRDCIIIILILSIVLMFDSLLGGTFSVKHNHLIQQG